MPSNIQFPFSIAAICNIANKIANKSSSQVEPLKNPRSAEDISEHAQFKYMFRVSALSQICSDVIQFNIYKTGQLTGTSRATHSATIQCLWTSDDASTLFLADAFAHPLHCLCTRSSSLCGRLNPSSRRNRLRLNTLDFFRS